MSLSGKKNTPLWLKGLNERQAEAVVHGEDPLLILAGAGSGKTRVITSRIAWMVAEKGFEAASILAVTFTNKAAAEMRERVITMVPTAEGAMIRTFHSFGAWLLRRNARSAGLPPNFTIYDDDGQIALLSQVLTGIPRRELRLWAHRISRAKDDGLGPDDDLSSFSHDPDLPEVYRAYEERLRSIGNVDFGDLILLPIRLLRNYPEIQARIQQRFRAVLVDEYQDTNVAQYLLLKELVGPHTWVAVVGDEDQSIYRFRGAEVRNILDFPKRFSGTRMIKLEQNYRSTAAILDIASTVVSHNTHRLGKNLWTSGEAGTKTTLAYLENHEEEAEWCADWVDAAGDFGGTAILYRTNAQSRVFETVFRRRSIPYRIVGTLSFYQREEVKDVLAYLSWISNTRDEVAFRRIANKPARGLGKTSLDRLISTANSRYTGDILKTCQKLELKGRGAKAAAFLVLLTKCYDTDGKFEHLGFLVRDLVESSGLLKHYQEVDRVESSRREANLDELVNAAAEYPSSPEGLAAFLELVELDQALLEEDENDVNRVTLITMHNTKGLEFNRVVVTGLEDGLFPRDVDEFDDEELEEERRLFYVAITRARKDLAFTTCRRRMLWGRWQDSSPSRFLSEIPEEYLRVDGMGPLNRRDADPWQPGIRLFHDDYGIGVIQKRILKDGHPVIHVRFESGRRAALLPEFTAHQMEILGTAGDDL